MKLFIVLAAVIAAVSAASYEDVFAEEWNLFKAEYKKEYEPIENFRRMEIFLKNKYEIAQHNLRYNKGEETYEMGLNEFSDWTPEELEARNGFNKELRELAESGVQVEFPEPEGELFEAADNFSAPYNMNWADKGAVSAVKNQGKCGSCYAFSALGALETQKYLATKKMVLLSEQQIVDCSGKFGNMGCNGGLACKTYNYIKANGGVQSSSSYPYEGKQSSCRFNKGKVAATVTGYVKVPVSEESLRQAVASAGSISVALNTLTSFNNYRGGIYYDPKCKSESRYLNHAVLLTGYGTDAKTKQDYWIVKNSWGTSWGERGYVRIARNKNNHCGIASYALYPKIR